MAEDTFFEIFRCTKELTNEQVKDLECVLGLFHQPWTKSTDGDARFVLEQMRQRMIWVFDDESKKCNFTRLAKYMECIQRHDLGEKLFRLGKAILHWLLTYLPFMIRDCIQQKVPYSNM